MAERYELHVISNTHWDREWLYDFQETRLQLVEVMDKLLGVLEKEPRYRAFLLDSQTAPLEDYLEIRPENRARIEAQVRAGRLLIGPWYTCPEEFNVNAESLVRNLLFGHKVAQSFGAVMKVGYSPFSYGQCSQMPQIYNGFGIDSILFYHGITPDESKSEFIFEGPDGSRLFASRMGSFARYNFYFHVFRPTLYGKSLPEREYFWRSGGLPFHLSDAEHYRDHHFLLDPPKGLDEERLRLGLQALKQMELEQCTTHYLAYMMGHDSSDADLMEVEIIERGKKMVGDDLLIHSTLPEWVEKVKAAAAGLTVLKGERRTPRSLGTRVHLFSDVTSSRTRVKQANSRAENLLQRHAEAFSSIAWLLGEEYPKPALDLAWRYLLQCHAHDSIAGSGVDQIERDMHARLDQVRNISSALARRALQAIQRRIDNSGESSDTLLLTAFNPSPYPRSEVLTAFVDLPTEVGINRFSVEDAETGRNAILQELSREDRMAVARHLGDATMEIPCTTVQFHFSADDVPPLGYRTYRIRPQAQALRLQENLLTGDRTMENEDLLVHINDDGTLRLVHKASGREFDNLHYFEDGGEAGHAWRHLPPAFDRAITTRGHHPTIALEETGALLARFRIDWALDIPAGLDEGGGDYIRRLDGDGDSARRTEHEKPLRITSYITLRRGAPSVEIETSFDNRCDSHRLRAMFPTNLSAAVSCAETAFDVVERPIGRLPGSPWFGQWNPTHPMQRFADVSDGKAGLAVIVEGLREYEVTDTPDRAIAITLLRAYEIALATVAWRWERHPEMRLSQCHGEHSFRYMICPHSGTWDTAPVLREAERLNAPLLVAQVGPHKGELPKADSFLKIEPGRAWLSALKQSEDGSGLVLRIFNPTGNNRVERVTLGLGRRIARAWLTNLNEERQNELSVVNGSALDLEIPPKKIVTVLLEAESAAP
jgi:alpha-mannosidase